MWVLPVSGVGRAKGMTPDLICPLEEAGFQPPFGGGRRQPD